MKHVQHRKRGRPSLSARVYIEPVYEATPNLERLARALTQYADAIPLDLLKEEQATLERAIADIDARFAALEQNYAKVRQNLDMVLELATNVKKLYKTAPEHIKRMLNQVFFEKVLVHAHDNVKPEKTPIFEVLLSAQTKQLATNSELFGQTLPQKMISYARCLSKQLLVSLSEADSHKYHTLSNYIFSTDQ